MPTLCMTSALDITQAVKPPRSVYLDFPLGHQIGKPFDVELQRNILRDAFNAASVMKTPGSIIHLDYRWSAAGDDWKDTEYISGYLPAYTRK